MWDITKSGSRVTFPSGETSQTKTANMSAAGNNGYGENDAHVLHASVRPVDTFGGGGAETGSGGSFARQAPPPSPVNNGSISERWCCWVLALGNRQKKTKQNPSRKKESVQSCRQTNDK